MITRKAVTEDLKSLIVLFDEYRVFYKKDSDLPGAELFLAKLMNNNESVIFIAEDEKK